MNVTDGRKVAGEVAFYSRFFLGRLPEKLLFIPVFFSFFLVSVVFRFRFVFFLFFSFFAFFVSRGLLFFIVCFSIVRLSPLLPAVFFLVFFMFVFLSRPEVGRPQGRSQQGPRRPVERVWY